MSYSRVYLNGNEYCRDEYHVVTFDEIYNLTRDIQESYFIPKDAKMNGV
ncbi:MAG: hypothetical protein KAJ93_01245 [Methanosarcinales archaeon]|nr:hypothetical protein [Methanosarcinales archaeon]